MQRQNAQVATLFVFVFLFGRIVRRTIRIRPNSFKLLFGTPLVSTLLTSVQDLRHVTNNLMFKSLHTLYSDRRAAGSLDPGVPLVTPRHAFFSLMSPTVTLS